MAAAKEFNIGKDTLVDFLVGKGFSKDELKPTSKLSEDMYRSLQQEFQGDKVAKIKSDQIDLPKGSVEAKKKKEDETIVFKKDTKKAFRDEPEFVKLEIPAVSDRRTARVAWTQSFPPSRSISSPSVWSRSALVSSTASTGE